MAEFKLTYDSEDGTEDIDLDSGKVSFGRGSEADYRFADDGLSRLHATVYCEEGNIWVVDENSSNGTLVNGMSVSSSGQPLAGGDVIKIGHHTNLRVSSASSPEPASVDAGPRGANSVASESDEKPPLLIPLAVIGIAGVLIITSLAIIAITIYSGPDREVGRNGGSDTEWDVNDDPDPDSSPTTDPGNTSPPLPSAEPTVQPTNDVQIGGPTGPQTPLPPALPKKQYKQMTAAEQNLYIKVKAEKVARLIGNRSSGDIPPAAVTSIKKWVDQYARRFNSPRRDDCTPSFVKSDMHSVLARAAKNVPFITRSFRSQAVDPQVGIYVAMIESEHCVCLQSYTKPLGMFQFTYKTAKSFGLKVKEKASPSNPDERCEPEPASVASAKYLRYLSGRIGTGPLSVPLAIASYNSGEGGLGRNLMTALTSGSSEERSFWTLIADAEQLSVQFKSENIKYVPKFFGAAIIGENPRDFGANMQPLSTYTR